MSHDLGSARRHHLADILLAYSAEHLDLVSAVDAIELDVFGRQAPEPEPPSPAAALVTTAVAVLLVSRDLRSPADAVELGANLSDELGKRGLLNLLEVGRD